LHTLEWHHAHGLRPPVGAFCRYHHGGTPPANVPASVFGELHVFRLDGPEGLGVESTLKLTAGLRAAAMRMADDGGGGVPELLSGHRPDGRPADRPHAAYLALPFVSARQRHADGHVLGVAVAFPRAVAPDSRRPAARALKRLDHLTVGGVGRLGLRRLGPDEPAPLNLRTETWVSPARRWASVTPVLLDRFPKRGGPGVAEVLAGACENVGLPRPVEVAAGRHSPLYGVRPSHDYLTRRARVGAGLAAGWLYLHATLAFDRPVLGPVVLGAGRYFGLGLCRPLPEGWP
jgi:CRISPR-associated protein Csb2